MDFTIELIVLEHCKSEVVCVVLPPFWKRDGTEKLKDTVSLCLLLSVYIKAPLGLRLITTVSLVSLVLRILELVLRHMLFLA